MSKGDSKVCFVVMGFGKKTDYESGRTLDLDATYEAIIQPAVEDNGLRCIRADEIMRSGVIDTAMYEMLLRADLVVADISTGNVNAVYELGVRHTLRPYSTIIMKEADGKLHFDLDHVNTFQYEHLGADIGQREAKRARAELAKLIAQAMAAEETDSPVYTYLPKLQRPRLTDEEYAELLDETEAMQEQLLGDMRRGEAAMRESRFGDAVEAFSKVRDVKPADPFVVQQLALATYKSKAPSALEALLRAREILAVLQPEQSNDPETLGIHGAIRKRLWELTEDPVQLDAAIQSYGRGFEVRRDYYNGENFALCLDLRAVRQADPNEANFDRMLAKKVRSAVYEITKGLMEADSFAERSDQRWILATGAHMALALERLDEARRLENAFLEGEPRPAEWEVETFNIGKLSLLQALSRDNSSGPTEPRRRTTGRTGSGSRTKRGKKQN